MPRINNLDLLRPDIRAACEEQMRTLSKQHGIVTILFETYRSPEVQLAYYMQGREPLDAVNAQRKIAGLYLLGADENKRIITNAKTSEYHGSGRAYDLVPARYVKGVLQPWWDAPTAVWETMGTVGEKLGMTWGGRWKSFKDSPHYQKE